MIEDVTVDLSFMINLCCFEFNDIVLFINLELIDIEIQDTHIYGIIQIVQK